MSAIQYIITFSYKTTTLNSSCVVVHHRAAFVITETTAVDNQFTAIIVFNGIHATHKNTIVDSQFRSSLIGANYIVLTRIRASRIVIITIHNQAGKLTFLPNPSIIVDGHFTMVQNVVIAITTRSFRVLASFFTTEIRTTIQNNSTVVNNISLTIGNVINSTRRTVLVRRFAITCNGQSCTQSNSNRIAVLIGQCTVSQIQRNIFISWNLDILSRIRYQFHRLTGGSRVNGLLQRRIFDTANLGDLGLRRCFHRHLLRHCRNRQQRQDHCQRQQN